MILTTKRDLRRTKKCLFSCWKDGHAHVFGCDEGFAEIVECSLRTYMR